MNWNLYDEEAGRDVLCALCGYPITMMDVVAGDVHLEKKESRKITTHNRCERYRKGKGNG